MTDLLEQVIAAHVTGIESVPFPTFEHLTPVPRNCACGLPIVAMVYRWEPDGGSVYEPRCRDHKDEEPS